MRRISLTVVFAILVASLFAQDRYIVFLKDKANTPYQLNNPSAFLSTRSIERKNRMGIPIDSSDIPVNPSYLAGIANAGARILNTSRWYNWVTVQADTANIIAVGNLSYVKSYKKVFGANLHKGVAKPKYEEPIEANPIGMKGKVLGNYGGALNQTQMLNANLLHSAGFTGRSMVIAVIDAGFTNSNGHRAFDSLRNENRLLGTWDFSRNNADVYSGFSNHGTSVLSCIGANVPDTIIGTAPHAKFYLLRSEEEATEYEVEEYNWVAAAEYADSVGADIINSSLGYTEFDAKSQNHTYNDMNGNTAVVTKGANLASLKGILVINSAGNSGGDPWNYIGAPADGAEVFSIGAVSPDEQLASFSSKGPTSDNRIKPDVCAQGSPAFVARASGSYGNASGTSFSSPIIAGFSACAFELYKIAHPNAKPAEVKAWIKKYSDRNTNPNNEYGYGIPDGAKLLLNASVGVNTSAKYKIYPNPSSSIIYVDVNNGANQNWDFQIISITGAVLYQANFNTLELMQGITLPPNISKGFYIISLSNNKDSFKEVFIKE